MISRAAACPAAALVVNPAVSDWPAYRLLLAESVNGLYKSEVVHRQGPGGRSNTWS
jgi:hypothetical protein